MIDKIKINSLKCISNIDLAINKLNFLTGTNSSGKSSTIQGLLLSAQNLEELCGLNGPLVTIGNFREARNFNIPNTQVIEISISDKSDEVRLEIYEDKEVKLKGNLDSALAYTLNYKNGKIHYLSCNRIGSRDIYSKNMTRLSGVGIDGEYAVEYLSRFKNEPLEEYLVRDRQDYTLDGQVNYWLNYIVGATIKTEEIIGTDVVKASYGLVDGQLSRPKNVGSGISYLISIIISCLSSQQEDLIIIENPEIHLHPLSQSRLCEFIYFISQSNRQLFIETHSDHFFNAVRVGIATGEMKKEDINVNFFKLGSDNCTRRYEIDIEDNGRIVNPIPNLFDQFELDLNRMLGV